MTIESDAERTASYFDPAAFGTTATIDSVPDIPGLFSDTGEAVALNLMTIESDDPIFYCNHSAVSAVPAAAAVVVNAESFTIKQILGPDDGIAILLLRRST